MRVSLVDLIKETVEKFSADICPTRAAAIAYYTVFALPSILLIVVRVAGFFFGRAAASGQIQHQASDAFGAGVAAQLRSMVEGAAQGGQGGIIATLVGVAGLIFATTTVFGELQSALNRMWGVTQESARAGSLVRKRVMSFLLVVGISLLMLASLSTIPLLSYLSSHAGLPYPRAVLYLSEIVVSWVVFTLVFATIFKVLPDADLAWKEVETGAMITAALFVLGKILIGFYLARAATASAYGAAGALVLLLLWTYYSAMIFLFGAEFTQVWVHRHGGPIPSETRSSRIRQQEPEPAHR